MNAQVILGAAALFLGGMLLGSVATWAYLWALKSPLIFAKDKLMAVIAAFQPVLDELNALPGAITQALSNAPLPAGAASAQDVTDTLGAVQTAADAAKAAVPAA